MNFKREEITEQKQTKATAPLHPHWQINASSTIESYYRTTGDTNSVLTDAQSDLGLYKTV